MISTSSDDKNPRIELAAIASASTSQRKNASAQDITHEIKRHHFAGQLKASMRMSVARIGRNAMIANMITSP